MKKIILLSALSLLTLAACDSKQQDKADVKVDVTKTEAAQPATTQPATSEPASSVASPVEQKVEAKVEPVKVDPPVAKVSMTGDKVYAKSCVSCHGTGAAGAPKMGDKAAWSARIAKGSDALYTSSIKGIAGTAMMPKGTCAACSDDELKAAVDYMVSKSK